MGYLSISSPVLLISWSIMYYAAGGVAVPTADVINSSLEPQLRQKRQVTSCPITSGWETHLHNCFYFSSKKVTWEKARDNCVTIGEQYDGHINVYLAELNNPQNLGSDMWLMEQITEKANNVWLGAHSPDHNTESWKWVTSGRTFSVNYPLWGWNQPDNEGGDQYCVATWRYPGRTPMRQYLVNKNCDNRYHYVCQYEL